jgi:uncharacterized protein YidB (DUF937 family)
LCGAAFFVYVSAPHKGGPGKEASMDWIKSLFGAKARPSTREAATSGPEAQQVYGLIAQYIDSQGGLAAVVKRFEQSGFIAKARSWVSTGQNAQINSVEVLQLLGLGTLSTMAREAGIPVDRLRDLLADLLPKAIDQATPSGKL